MQSRFSGLWRSKPKFADMFRPLDGKIFLPEAAIICTPRGGTSSLFYNLREHPDFFPRDLTKETYILSWSWEDDKKTPPKIKSMFEHPIGTFNIEGSPGDLSHPNAAERVWNLNPNQKFIAMFRDPVIRAHENFWLVVKGREETVSTFAEAIALEESRLSGGMESMLSGDETQIRNCRLYPYLERGKYVKHLRKWLKYFPMDQFLFIKSEDYFANPQQVLDQVCDFIGVKRFTPKNVVHWWDAIATAGSTHGRWPVGKLDPDLAKSLYDLFRPYNEELSQLLGRDFTWEFQEVAE